jgi:hypothetical protein
MTATFLVAVELDPSADFAGIAEDIKESLEIDGIAVSSVRPWGRDEPQSLPMMQQQIQNYSNEQI